MKNVPHHIGIIPDGNRRFAKKQKIGLPYSYLFGAALGLEAVEWARKAGVRHLSFFGTSNENVLRRPTEEIHALRKGVTFFLVRALHTPDTAIHIVGDIKGIAQTPRERKFLLDLKQRCDEKTGKLVVHVDVNYSGEIKSELAPLFDAIKRLGLNKVRTSPEKFICSAGVPPVDLVIRVGGRPRLSGFLPFQTTYAELYFRNELWGDFTKEMFEDALNWYAMQDRSQGA